MHGVGGRLYGRSMAFHPFSIAEPLRLTPTDQARSRLTGNTHVTYRVIAMGWDDANQMNQYLAVGEGLTQPQWLSAGDVQQVVPVRS